MLHYASAKWGSARCECLDHRSQYTTCMLGGKIQQYSDAHFNIEVCLKKVSLSYPFIIDTKMYSFII